MQWGPASFDKCGLGMKREGMSGSPPSSGTLTYVLLGFGFYGKVTNPSSRAAWANLRSKQYLFTNCFWYP